MWNVKLHCICQDPQLKYTYKGKEGKHMNRICTTNIRKHHFLFVIKMVYKYIFYIGTFSLQTGALWHPNPYRFPFYMEISEKEVFTMIELALKDFCKWGERNKFYKSSQCARSFQLNWKPFFDILAVLL